MVVTCGNSDFRCSPRQWRSLQGMLVVNMSQEITLWKVNNADVGRLNNSIHMFLSDILYHIRDVQCTLTIFRNADLVKDIERFAMLFTLQHLLHITGNVCNQVSYCCFLNSKLTLQQDASHIYWFQNTSKGFASCKLIAAILGWVERAAFLEGSKKSPRYCSSFFKCSMHI